MREYVLKIPTLQIDFPLSKMFTHFFFFFFHLRPVPHSQALGQMNKTLSLLQVPAVLTPWSPFSKYVQKG